MFVPPARLRQSADAMRLAIKSVIPIKAVTIALVHLPVPPVQLSQSADAMILAIKFVTPIKAGTIVSAPMPVPLVQLSQSAGVAGMVRRSAAL